MSARSLTWILVSSTLVSACTLGPEQGELPLRGMPIVVRPVLTEPSAEEAALRATFAERVEARRRELDERHVRARAARAELTLARHAEVEAAGGYEASVRLRLSQLVESLPMQTGELHARGLELQGLLVGELDRLRCAGPELLFAETGDTSMQVHPGTYLILTGCRFGTRDGAVRLELSRTGEVLPLTPRSWKPDTILVEVPDKTGVLDQEATLSVVTNFGDRSNDLSVEFRAQREIQVYFGAYLGVESHPTHLKTIFGLELECPLTLGAPRLKRLLWTVFGYHYQYGDLYPTSGRDRLIMVLAEQWNLTDWFFESQGWAVMDLEPGNVTSYRYFPGSLAGLPVGAHALEFEVDWWVDRTNSSVRYDTAMLVEGPRGTPYAVTPGESGLKSAEEWNAEWAELVGDGALPGTPCDE